MRAVLRHAAQGEASQRRGPVDAGQRRQPHEVRQAHARAVEAGRGAVGLRDADRHAQRAEGDRHVVRGEVRLGLLPERPQGIVREAARAVRSGENPLAFQMRSYPAAPLRGLAVAEVGRQLDGVGIKQSLGQVTHLAGPDLDGCLRLRSQREVQHILAQLNLDTLKVDGVPERDDQQQQEGRHVAGHKRGHGPSSGPPHLLPLQHGEGREEHGGDAGQHESDRLHPIADMEAIEEFPIPRVYPPHDDGVSALHLPGVGDHEDLYRGDEGEEKYARGQQREAPRAELGSAVPEAHLLDQGLALPGQELAIPDVRGQDPAEVQAEEGLPAVPLHQAGSVVEEVADAGGEAILGGRARERRGHAAGARLRVLLGLRAALLRARGPTQCPGSLVQSPACPHHAGPGPLGRRHVGWCGGRGGVSMQHQT
mmetsp:Transcript_80553/g.249943  ORF Transcript_80553/g.249943 Transcript_80553/m.249943 type:complete len:424 (+) Transcript_80553:1368-2639(+)